MAVLWITPAEGWHAYAAEPGETGMPTRLMARLQPSGREATVLYPPGRPQPDTAEPDKTVNVYEGRTPLFVPLPDGAEKPVLSGELTLLLCSGVRCQPVRMSTAFDTGQAQGAVKNAQEQDWWPLFSQSSAAAGGEDQSAEAGPAAPTVPGSGWEFSPRYLSPHLEVSHLWQALLLAVLAGAILNVMPCVLPVVGLKIFGVIASIPHESPRRQQAIFREKNIFFALGIILYFLFLSIVLGLAGMAWGQIFQKPEVVIVVIGVVFSLALSLLGVFNLPIVDLKSPKGVDRNPKMQALFTGVLATLLATPCSGPFLGGVLAWAFLQPPHVISLVFTCIGLGMAAPYLVFSLRPEAARFFPKPGPWVERLEKVVAFFLFGTCVYLFGILPDLYHVPALSFLLATSIAAWIWGKLTSLSDSAVRRRTVRAVAAAIFLASAVWAAQPRFHAARWEPFKPQEFRSMLGSAPILMDFTADWCPNCKLLEKTVLTDKRVASLADKYHLTLVQADLTREDPEALALLRSLGSQSIPVVAIFPAGQDAGAPVVLRDLFTKDDLKEALKGALENETGTRP